MSNPDQPALSYIQLLSKRELPDQEPITSTPRDFTVHDKPAVVRCNYHLPLFKSSFSSQRERWWRWIVGSFHFSLTLLLLGWFMLSITGSTLLPSNSAIADLQVQV